MQVRAGKARVGPVLSGRKPGQGGGAVGDDRRPGFAHPAFQRVVPDCIGDAIAQQAVAVAHGLFIGQACLGMVGAEGQRHAVQEPSAPLGGFDPQPVHRGHQPQDAGDAAQRRLRGRLAVDAHLPRLGAFRPGRDLVRPVQAVQLGLYLPAQRLGAAGQIVRGRAAQPPTGRQQRHGFQHAGLARAIGAEQNHGTAIEAQPRRPVAAEMRKGQRRDRKPWHDPSFFIFCSEISCVGSGGCKTPGGCVTRASA